MTQNNEEMSNEVIEKMLKNPKIIKAMEGILAPLKKEGDSLTIKGGTNKTKNDTKFLLE